MANVYNLNGNAIIDGADIRAVNFNFSSLVNILTANSGHVTYSSASEILAREGVLQYVGAICVNKKIYCCPNSSDHILVYDTVKEQTYFIAKGLGTNQFKWTGLVCYDGFIYTIPRGVNAMLRIDPITDDVRIIELGTNYAVNPYGNYKDSHHYNGVISDSGYLYCPPTYYSYPTCDKLLKINMSDFTWEELSFPIGCSGAVKHPTEDKIFFMASSKFILWDCATDTYEEITTGLSNCFDMIHDPRYPNYMIGVYGSGAFAYNMTNKSITTLSMQDSSVGYGITLGLDGNYYHFDSGKVLSFSFNGSTLTEAQSHLSYTTSGTTPYCAGQAIDNDGNIYGVPASGGFVKLAASGVVSKLPDYIVSSQYYGEY